MTVRILILTAGIIGGSPYSSAEVSAVLGVELFGVLPDDRSSYWPARPVALDRTRHRRPVFVGAAFFGCGEVVDRCRVSGPVGVGVDPVGEFRIAKQGEGVAGL
jgi:hypothetical protein